MKKHITKTRPNHRFASFKNKQMISAHNLDTKKYLYHLELDFKVKTYTEGGNTVLLSKQNYFTRFKPHFSVTKQDEKQVIYIDRKTELTDYIVVKLNVAYHEYEQSFIRIIPSQIYLQPYLENAEFLYRFAWEPVTIELKFAILDFFQDPKVRTIKDFQTFLESRHLYKSSVFSLIHKGYLKVDMHKKVDEKTILQMGDIQEVSI